jgi:ATP-dependent RNA circularization protein (DNA/RNA ligase family)
LNELKTKYPRTYHLPFSPGKGNDDKVMSSIDHFVGLPLIISEKMDGSNVAMTSKNCFSRSHSGPPTHESFDGFKALHASIKYIIPEGMFIFGEWCYAKHSIFYNKLPSYFLLFGVRDINYNWLSWNDVVTWADSLGLNTVPVLQNETFKNANDLKKFITKEAKKPSVCGDTREGLVIRNSNSFNDNDFSTMVAKYVRLNHVTTSIHWKHQDIIKNTLRKI